LDEAERALRATLEMFPASGDARWALAEAYERLDRPMDAIATLEDATRLTIVAGRSSLYWRIAELAHAYQRDNARVIPMVSRRTWLLLNDARAHTDMGMVYYRAGRMDEAMIELLMSSLLGYTDATMLSAMGQIHLGSGRLDLAETATRRAITLDPELPQPRYVLGRTLMRLGKNDEGMEQLTTFKRLQAAVFQMQWRIFERDKAVHRARSLAKSGRLVEAATAYEKAASLAPSTDLYEELAATYAKLGRTADQKRTLARIRVTQE
jgi:tetratricopeptide (TPR) repeat protein